MMPDFGGLIWMIVAFTEGIVFFCVSLLFYFWVMPAISRRFIRIKWSKGSPAFIQHAGRVHVFSSDAELPEGVIHNKAGWFLKSVAPYKGEGEEEKINKEVMKHIMEKYADEPEKMAEALKKFAEQSKKKKRGPKPKQDEEVNQAFDIALRTPILEGLGRQVFFGSSDTPLLSNLETIGVIGDIKVTNGKGTIWHSVMHTLKEIIPATISRSQLDALGTYEYLRGLKVRGTDMIRLVVIAIAVIGVIVTAGLVFWFLMQG